ncbi:MAG: DUF2062 domain-containing protein [Burkholderiaceae bacterium]
MKQLIKRWTPSAESVRSNKSLRWLGPLLNRPWLWQLNRRSVSLGVAIGVFFGFLVPVLQALFSAVFALVFRANLPVAIVSTLVSNPFTYAPIGILAYQLGSAVLGESTSAEHLALFEDSVEEMSVSNPSTWDQILSIGKPVFLGLAIFAVVGSVSAFVLTNLSWRIVVASQRARRRKKRYQALKENRDSGNSRTSGTGD